MLFLYKLDRAFPLDYIRVLFYTDLSNNFNKDFILTLNKIPYIKIMCILFFKYCRSNSNITADVLSDFNKAIDCIFPTIEKLFFAMLTSKYPLEKLDKYLETHCKIAIENQPVNTSVNNPNHSSKSLFDPVRSLFYIENSTTPYMYVNSNDAKTDLPTLFTRFVKEFPYKTNESSFDIYNREMGYCDPISYEGIPFTIHNKRDFWTFMNMYLRLPPNQEDLKPSSDISNRTELLLSVAEILNDIIDFD